MADGYYDPILGQKREAGLPDYNLNVYRGEGVPTGDQTEQAMTPDQRRLLAMLQAIRMRRMQQQAGAGAGQVPQAIQGQGGM